MGHTVRLLMQYITLFFLLTISFGCQSTIKNSSTDASASTATDKHIAGLENILPLYKEAMNRPWPIIPAPTTKKSLQIGMKNNNVLLLRERLQRTHDLAEGDTNNDVFDKPLEDGVKLFQSRHGLKADGVVGLTTRAALNVPPAVRVEEILLNIKRFQKLSTQLSQRYVLINIPEYQLHLIDHDKEVLTMKVIIGRPSRPTPELSSTITRLILNPHWHVPHMIAQNDIVPKEIENPDYLNDNHIRIFNHPGDHATEVSEKEVNWQDADENGFKYYLRQDPGLDNALGVIKFEFANTHDVYLHDTPAKNLFAETTRDFSSGCIRLEKPFDLAFYLTQNDPDLNKNKIQQVLDSKKTSYFKVKDPINIYIAYITAWVDDKGIVNFRDDIYHLDS